MADFNPKTIKGNIGGVYFTRTGNAVDPFNLTKYNPNTNQNSLLIYLEDGVEENVVTVNFAPNDINLAKKGWTSHDFPAVFRGYVNHTVNGESSPRTFAQYMASIPTLVTDLNLNNKKPMGFSATVIQTSGVNLLGSFNTYEDLVNAHTPTEELFDQDAIAYVFESNAPNGFYKLQYSSNASSYYWELFTGALSLSLDEKQYNITNMQVQGGYRNPAPIIPLQDEQYRIIWQNLNEVFSLYASIENRLSSLEQDVIDLNAVVIKNITKTDTNTVKITLVRNGSDFDIEANVNISNNEFNLISINANNNEEGLFVDSRQVVSLIQTEIETEDTPLRVAITNLINETVDIDIDGAITTKIAEHNTNPTAHQDIRNDIDNLKEYVDVRDTEVLEDSKEYTDLIASGKQSQGLVFVNAAQIQAWINGQFIRPDGILPSDLRIGQDLYTLNENDNDYWVNSLPVLTMGNLSAYGGGSSELNPYTVKILYESNPDTNAFTDLEKAEVEKIPTIEQDINDLENNKVDKVAGKQLSTEDFTTAEKTKLSGIATNAQVNILEGVQLNGTDVTISSKKSNIVVNKTTVGLGSVQNYGIASQGAAEAGTAMSSYMTPLRTKQAIDVGARASTWTPTWSEVSGKPSWIGASKPTYTYAEIGGTKPPADADKTPDLKTINGESIVGTGNIVISGGGETPTYPEMTQALIDTGTSATTMVISPKLFKDNLNTKENLIVAGTTSQYLRGDKTWQTLNKATVGLGSVNNTSDLDKPISTATQSALDNKISKAIHLDTTNLNDATSEQTLYKQENMYLATPERNYPVQEAGMLWVYATEDESLMGVYYNQVYITNSNIYMRRGLSKFTDIFWGNWEELVDKKFTLLEKNKLAGIEIGAQVNPTASEIKTLYESNPNTNAFTDNEKSQVSGMYNDNYFKGVSLNNTNYVITFTRRDNSTATIDLPLESVVVNGAYENDKIVLTLQNGNTVEIPLGDLVDGLMSAPSTNKGETTNKTLTYGGTFKVLEIDTNGTITERVMTLPALPTKAQVGLGNVPNVDTTNPANITQNATHRFVSDSEKSTWNGKQNALVSGTNIKTINGETILGSGNIIIEGGSGGSSGGGFKLVYENASVSGLGLNVPNIIKANKIYLIQAGSGVTEDMSPEPIYSAKSFIGVMGDSFKVSIILTSNNIEYDVNLNTDGSLKGNVGASGREYRYIKVYEGDLV